MGIIQNSIIFCITVKPLFIVTICSVKIWQYKAVCDILLETDFGTSSYFGDKQGGKIMERVEWNNGNAQFKML